MSSVKGKNCKHPRKQVVTSKNQQKQQKKKKKTPESDLQKIANN